MSRLLANPTCAQSLFPTPIELVSVRLFPYRPYLSGASSLSDRIDHLDQKLETFADVLSNDVKLARESNDVALAALNDSISQLQNLLKAQLADKGQKDDGLGTGSSSSSSSEEEEEKEKRKTLNLTARRQDFRRRTAKNNIGDSLGDVRLTQSLLTAETLPTFHGKPNEDPNIFLTSFDRYAHTMESSGLYPSL
ncbi:hypothetical protein QOT17_024605 [Balamuthia mandrillaris]